jgi:hypothetical protein
MVIVTGRDRFPICFECQRKELEFEIKDPAMKKMFDIPDEFYKENSFLRSIKLNYKRFENLTEKQIAAFKKTVAEMKNPKPKEAKEIKFDEDI